MSETQKRRVCLACGWMGHTRRVKCACGHDLIHRKLGLKVCRECTAYFDAGPTARNTARCPACVAANPKTANLRRTCVKCGYMYKGLLLVCPCGGRMLSSSERGKVCKTCGAAFATNGRQVYCEECIPYDTQKKRRQRAAAKADVKPSQPATPCATCKHGASSTIADSGYLCRIERAGACRPFSIALYYQKETTIV